MVRPRRWRATPRSAWQPGPPLSRAAVARLVQLTGLFNVITGVLPPPHGRLAELSEFVPTAGIISARAATAVIGVLLIYVGAGLRRGKHRAWQVAVALAGTSLVLHLAKGLDFEPAVVCGALLALLVVVRRRFHAVPDRRGRWRVLSAPVGLAVAGFVVGFAEIAVRDDRLVGDPGWIRWAEQAALGVVGVSGPLHFRDAYGGVLVAVTTGAFGLLAAAVAVVLLLLPGAPQPVRTEQNETRLRELLARHGHQDSLGYFALRGDKSLAWARSGKAAVAYRVIGGVSLASGDPIGDVEAWPHAIATWLSESDQHGWIPAVLGCGAAGGKAYRRSGLDVIELGDEAIVDVASFTLQGRPMRAVRQAVARARRVGYTCQVVRQRDLPPAVVAEAVHAAAAFRDGKVERGFSMALSRLGDPRDGDCLLVLCRDSQSRLRGVLQLVPWGDDGLSLDLMRGDRAAENGLTELMMVSAIDAAGRLGVRRVSLNFAVLRSVFARAEDLGAGPVLRMWHRVLLIASRFWQIESLYRANLKYQPAWHPRYLCFPTARDVPLIAVAALKAEAFLPSGQRLLTGRDGPTASPPDPDRLGSAGAGRGTPPTAAWVATT
ncbi:phosphatidylglycerol lysyltransferase domain-containing protein [Micromonospora sp. CPCC 205371]|nr:phosphatidylglycerol lysyltransferase domain-containing protein [Micromonospora sp. CPCC 205371]